MRFTELFITLNLLLNVVFSIVQPMYSFPIAYNNGSVSVGFKKIKTGYNDSINFFTRTLGPDRVEKGCGKYCLYEITMGEFTDWLIPAIDTSKTNSSAVVVYPSFQVLCGGVRNKSYGEDQGMRPYTYSPISPLSQSFDGYSRLVSNYFGESIYGSSPANYVENGTRNRLIAFGANDLLVPPYDPSEKGGCCWLNNSDRFGFNKPYNITGHVLHLEYLYLHVISLPAYHYAGQKVGVKAVVVDIFMRTSLPEAASNWVLKRNDSTDAVEVNGTATFYANLTSPINGSNAIILTLEVDLISPKNKTLWPGKKINMTLSFTLPPAVKVLPPGRPIDFKAPIMTMLRFTSWYDPNAAFQVECPINYSVALNTKFFGSDVDIMPKKDETMETADKNYVQSWQSITTTDGIFGTKVSANNTFQYFAFAVYNPVKQPIPIDINCSADAFCFVYLNGTLYDNAAPYPSPHLEYPTFEKGWIQAIVKFASNAAYSSGFKLSFEASGLVFNEEVPSLQ